MGSSSSEKGDHRVLEVRARLKSASRREAWALLKNASHAPPRFFYKYIAPTSLSIRSLIVKSQLWLASPESFNDPFEMALNVKFEGKPAAKISALQTMARSTGVSWKERRRIAQIAYAQDPTESMNENHRKLVKQFGVTCLSGAGARNLLMWSHYADAHRGICFQFHLPSTPNELLQAFPVRYSDDYPVVNWVQRKKVEQQLGDALYQKSLAWSYENEFRIVERLCANSHYPVKPSGVTGLVLGARASDDLIATATQLIRERESLRLPRIKLFRAKLDASRYRIVICRALEIEAACYV